jgi:hypothetical protein
MDHKAKKKYIPLLKVLQKLKPEDVTSVMDFLTDDSIDNICECVYNILNTDLKLTPKKKSHLKKFIKSNCSIHRLHKISKKTTPVSKRRKALKQEGHGLPLILASVIPFLTSLFTGK